MDSSTSSGSSSSLNMSFVAGAQVAQLGLAAPTGDAANGNSFLLHGTVPLPADFFQDPQQHLAVADFDGTLIPAQIETVTRYPDGKRAIVEILAPVHRSQSVAPATRVSYDVYGIYYTAGSPPGADLLENLDPEIRLLLDGSRKILIEVLDVFGNRYLRGALANANNTTMRQGPYAQTIRRYGPPVAESPSTGATGTLPRMMGIHSYATAFTNEGALKLDLHFNNGQMGPDPSTPQWCINDLYFQSIRVLVPGGYVVDADLRDPLFSLSPVPTTVAGIDYDAYDLVAARSDGKMHIMPQQGQFHRRLAVAAPSKGARARALLDEEGLAFCEPGINSGNQPFFSFWNPATALYFPQQLPLPDMGFFGASALRTKLAQEFNLHRSIIQNGTTNPPFETGNLGWAHPYGVFYGGMTGGAWIYQWDGVEIACSGSNEGYREAQLVFRANTERQPDAFFNADGSHAHNAQFLKTGSQGLYQPYGSYYDGPNPNVQAQMSFFKLNCSPNFQEDFVHQNGLEPPYESTLKKYSPIDLQHFVRVTSKPMVLSYLGNDPMAKDEVERLADLGIMSFSKYYTNSSGAKGQLLGAFGAAQSNPGIGFFYGRGHAWGQHVANAAFALSDDAYRSRDDVRGWAEMSLDTLALAQIPCSGAVQAINNKSSCDATSDYSMQHESPHILNSIFGMKKCFFDGVDPARAQKASDVVSKGCYFLVGPLVWSGHGPYAAVAVRLASNNQPYCAPVNHCGNTNMDQSWAPLAIGYQLTGDPLFLTRAIEQGGGTIGALKNYLQSTGGSNYHLSSYAPVLATFQALGWVVP